jgi:nitrate/TMAO reductase-like tetraheme cytochrome c subunit
MNSMKKFSGLIRNWISMFGLLMGACVLLGGLMMVILDITHNNLSAYFGLIAYLLIPLAVFACGGLVALGMVLTHLRAKRQGYIAPLPVINLGDRRTVIRISVFVLLASIFVFGGIIVAYRAYHFTESVEFCGRVCHTVMKPEYTAFKQSPHANTSCAECHIGSGAEWFVKAKISGLYQVYSVLFNKYHRPIETPVQSLRPAKDTCLACHWPSKFFGAVMRTWTHYGSDVKNSPWTIKMLLKIGGGNPSHGQIRGIHWHMEGVNTVEYIASDSKRLVIPWVQATDQSGKVTVYRSEDSKVRITDEQAATIQKRSMDCMDCHNRPAHTYRSPNELLDTALFEGRLDSSIPSLKAVAAKLLAAPYMTEAEAFTAIERECRAKYPGDARLDGTIREIQALYAGNFFPEMKVRWSEYPNHIGHKITPGCFRCHDGNHVSDSGKRISKDCSICHTILAQGPGTDLATFTSSGLEFNHPEDIGDEWKTARCDTCHTGSP